MSKLSPFRIALFFALPATAPLAGCSDASEDEEFRSAVVPILEQHCASTACHGITPAIRQSSQLDPSKWFTFSVNAAGKIDDATGARASAKAKINSREGTPLSSLLRKTLPVAAGGMFHYQGALFPSPADAGYKALSHWAARVKDGSEDADSPALTTLEKRFADKVFPILIRKGCATATCHGDLNFGVSLFKAPLDPARPDQITRRDLRDAYRNARANLTLWGDPLQSRLITKIVPLESGGIPHKGGNDQFFSAVIEQGMDPRQGAEVAEILGWLGDERSAALGAAGPAAGKAAALVFVGGPLPLAGPFDGAPFTPGSDLYRLDAPFTGAPVNLTGAAHSGPADIRDPAVSHDGRTLVFSMRTAADDAANLYSIGVDGTGLLPLTHDTGRAADGGAIDNRQPIYGPPGAAVGPGGGPPPAERIYFVSSKSAGLSDDAHVRNSDLWAIDTDGGRPERLTFTVNPEVRPWFLTSGEFAGTVAYTIKRSSEGGYKGVLFRFPIDHNAAFHIQPEAHPHFGMSEPPHVFYGLREMANGRAVLTLQDEGNASGGGQLALLERQFAVEVPESFSGMVTLPGFRHALTILSPAVARQGASADGYYRDPTPLPDGSIVAVRVEGMVDLAAPPASPTTKLVRLTLGEDRASFRPTIASTAVIPTPAGMTVSQPVAVFPRGAEDEPHPRAWNDTDTTGLVVHSGVTVIEAVLAQMAPVAPRTLRADLAAVRAVVPLQVAGAVDVTAVPAGENRWGYTAATQASLTGRMPLFSAFEVPPAPDGSLAAHVPAHVPFRVVSVGADGIATGALQHQWYAVLPGERFPVGIPASSFSARCAGCHGAMDGKADSVLQPATDAVTQASVTAATYEESDRRRPAMLPTITPAFFTLVDFRKDVQPILDARCVSCHGTSAPKGGVSLTSTPTAHYTDAYESLLAPGTGSAGGFAWVDADGYLARRSALAERLLGRELEAPRVQTGKCPPDGATPLTDAERLTLLRWMEFGAAFIGTP